MFARMRFVNKAGCLEFHCKGGIDAAPENYFPWFQHPDRKITDCDIIFGHWAALDGKTGQPNVHALDTGCAWGYELTALCIETKQRVSVSC